MLPWLRQKLHKRVVLFAKLCFFSCIGHIFFFLLLMVSLRDHVQTIVVSKSIQKNPASIVFLPLQKRVQQPKKSMIIAQKSQKKVTPKKEQQKKIVSKPKAKKRTIIKTKSSPKIKVKQKPKVCPKPKIKPIPKKKIALPKKKKQPKIKPKQKVISQNKKQATVSKPKKQSVPKPKSNTTKKPIKKEAVQKNVSVDKKDSIKSHNKNENVLYVGREDLKDLKIQQELCQQLRKIWNPPAGVSKECICKVRFVVSNVGSVKDIKIEESSNVIMYDVAVRAALSKAQFSPQTHNKEFIVAFKP